MLTNWNGRALALAAGVALAASGAAAAQAEVAGGVIGCDASGNKQIAGAIIGGVLGGVAGNNIIKKDQQAGTIVGATAGAAAGSYVGCNMQKKDAERAYASPPARVSYEEAPRETVVVRQPPPARVRYEEAPQETVVVRQPPPRVVYEAPPPPPPRVVYQPPPRTVVVREPGPEVYYEKRERKHGRWANSGYGMPPGHSKRYLIGERMPVAYVRQREYVIVEPTRYRLRPAPVGYRWVRYDRDAYLVAAETGLISQVVRAVLD